jgi:hypothetical protein
MTKEILLVEKVNNPDQTISLIAECNGYVDEVRVIQFSRSPFSFADTITDQEIIDFLWGNDYAKYL